MSSKRRAGAAEATVEPVIGAKKIEDGRDMRLAVGERDPAYRNVAQEHIAALIVLREMLVQLAAEIGEGDRHDVVAAIDQAQRETDILAGLAVLGLEIPASLGVAFARPAITDRALRHDEFAGLFRESQPSSRRRGRLRRAGEDRSAAHSDPAPSARRPAPQPHQHRHVGVAAGIVLEIGHLPIEKEFAQDHVAHGHRERGIGALLRVKPKSESLATSE